MVPSITYIWLQDVLEVPVSLGHSPALETLAEAGTAAWARLSKGLSSAMYVPTSLSFILKMIVREYHSSGTWKRCYSHAQMRTGAETRALWERCSDPWWWLGKLKSVVPDPQRQGGPLGSHLMSVQGKHWDADTYSYYFNNLP